MTRASDHASRRPVAIDIFSGAGGLTLGFEAAGFDVLAAVEYDPVHAATHAYNFPLTPVLCRDVRKISALELLSSAKEGWEAHYPEGPEWDGVVDVIVGGPSCQGFSSMGKREVTDDRNELVTEFVRLVEEIRPRAFVMENVPGIFAPQFEQLIDNAIDRLRRIGYNLGDYRTLLDAKDYGVPQRRKRMFMVGTFEDEPVQIRPKSTKMVPTSMALAGLPSLIGRRQSDGELLELDEEQFLLYSNASNEYLEALRKIHSQRRVPLSRVLSGCLATEHRELSVTRFEQLPQGAVEPISRIWRIDPKAPARTLRAGTGRERGAFSAARPLHPTEPRVVTVREAARIHSFPDWFRFHSTNWHAHRQIGNSVPPLLGAVVAESVRISLGFVTPVVSKELPVVDSSDQLLGFSPTKAASYFSASKVEVPMSRRDALQSYKKG